MSSRFCLVLFLIVGFSSGCEDSATRQARKNGATGQSAPETSSGGSGGFSATVEQNRAQHVQANQEFQDVLKEFAETVGSIKDIPSTNQALPKCDPLMDKMDAIIKKVSSYPKLKAAEKADLGNKDAQAEIDSHLVRAFGGARGHLLVSENEGTFNDIVTRFKEIVKKSEKVMLCEIHFRF